MKLTIKTLKGGKFTIDADPSKTIVEVKTLIEQAKSEFPAENMKLIHSGKVLKDDVTIESCQIKPSDFLVCMITKAKKKPAAPAATPAAAAPVPPGNTATATSTTSSSSSSSGDANTTTASTAVSTSGATSAAPPASSTTLETTTASATPTTSEDEFPAELVANLTVMGFPEAEARACLRAAGGNPDVAVEFLTNGIPPSLSSFAAGGSASPATSSTSSSANGEPLSALRNHPQFDALRRLVQTNPSALQAVLSQIGEQQPELLREINENQAVFLNMMNEPLTSTGPTSTTSSDNTGPATSSSQPPPLGLGLGLGGGPNPAQMARMLGSMNPSELNEMASMMGLTPQQLTATAQMIEQMPPDQLQQFMSQVVQQGGGGLGEGMGGGGGAHVLRLTEEEMAAVDRLTEMGFDRSEAAQAFLACDKNEALAANLLMDSSDGMGGMPSFPPPNNDNNDNSGSSNNDDTEDMYD